MENYIKRCIINATEAVIVHPPVAQASGYPSRAGTIAAGVEWWKDAQKQAMADFISHYLQQLLSQYHGVVARCARHAGVLPSDFWKLMRKYHLKAESYRALPAARKLLRIR